MQVYAAIDEVRELADGYVCRLPNDAGILATLAEYVSLDRMCCTFIHWGIDVEPNAGPIWLRITGGQGVKALTRQTFETTTLLRESVAGAAGLSISARTVWVHPSDASMSTANCAG